MREKKLFQYFTVFGFSHLDQPHPLDVGILLVAHAAHAPVGVHGVHNGRGVLGSLQVNIYSLQQLQIICQNQE